MKAMVQAIAACRSYQYAGATKLTFQEEERGKRKLMRQMLQKLMKRRKRVRPVFPQQPSRSPSNYAYKDPTLEDITIDGVAFARSLISDLALDVLLYQSSYRAEIAQTVIEESNLIVDKFRQRNPDFKGKIHLVGHSLGSAILFDILCHENRQRRHDSKPNPLRFLPHRGPARIETNDTLDFDVEDFYCLGSPIGLFQMLTGRYVPPCYP